MTESSTTAPAAASTESLILEYVTMAEAAEWAECGIYPIYKQAHHGQIRAARYGKVTLVAIDDVLARAEELRRESLASAEALAGLELPLHIINDARGTKHTVASLAEACGVDLENGASNADVDRMAGYIGSTLLAA